MTNGFASKSTGGKAYRAYKAKVARAGTTLHLTRQAWETSRSPLFRSSEIAKAPWLKRIINRMRGGS